jgi:hypothetical protein
MWKAGLFVMVTITSACGVYGNFPNPPGGPDECLSERHSCMRSSECCSGWCVSGGCERKMAQATPPPLSQPGALQ